LGDTLPSGLANTATISWSAQTLSNGSALAAGSAPTTVPVSFTQQTNIDDIATVTDTLGGTVGTVPASGPTNASFAFPFTFSSDPTGTCTSHPSTATVTTNSTGTAAAASQPVSVCVTAAPPAPSPPPPPTAPVVDHFLCYAGRRATALGGPGFDVPAGVGLVNQFNPPGFKPKIGALDVHCNPVEKLVGSNYTFVTNPDAHLLCWNITAKKQPTFTVQVSNQFGTALLKTGAATQLCLPSWTSLSGPPNATRDGQPVAPPRLSHFACYAVSYVRGTSPFKAPGPVQLQD